MFKKNAKSRLKEFAVPALFLAGGVIIWEVAASISGLPDFLFPKFSKIILEIFRDFPFLLKNTGLTMAEALIGFIIGNLFGFALAAVFVHSQTTEKGIYPLAIIFKTIPLIALAPFLVIIFGIGVSSKIAIVSIACFFPILVNALRGLKTIDRESSDLFKSLSASRWQTFLKLRVPNSLSYIFPALKTSAVISVLGAIMGEFVGANAGIGYVILASAQTFNIPAMFAAITMSSLASLLFFRIICLAEEKIIFGQKNESL
jgi:NitT/TauT family transport system permease protein